MQVLRLVVNEKGLGIFTYSFCVFINQNFAARLTSLSDRPETNVKVYFN